MAVNLNNAVRLVGGKYRGRQLTVLDLEGLRPTPSRVRESIFNLIGSKVEGARVLDLFAGSGALGFEAVSRGASSLVLVEKDRDNYEILTEEAASFKGAEIRTAHQDALQYLTGCKEQFDLVFLDPPYKADLLKPSLKLLFEKELITPESVVYAEMSSLNTTIVPGYEIIRQEEAGQVKFSLLRLSSFLF